MDINEFKKAMQEAKTALTTVNAEFKNVTAGMDKWSDTATGIEAKTKQLNATLKAQERQVAILQTAYDKLTKEEQENTVHGKRLYTQLLNKKTALEKTRKELNEVQKVEKEFKVRQEETKTATYKLNKTIEEQTDKLSSLKKKYSELILSKKGNKEEANKLQKEIKELSSKLQENKDKLQGATEKANSFDKSLKNVKSGAASAKGGIDGFTVVLANFASNILSQAVSNLKEFIKDSIRVGINFEKSMSKVRAISGANADEFKQLKAKAEEMGATTMFSATESANALENMARAGWKTNQMISGIKPVLDLSVASGEELATVSDIVTVALGGLGMSANEAGRFSDILARASSSSATTVSEMGEAFKYTAATAGSFKYSAEDLGLALSVMANASVRGSMAGTSLRAIMLRLANPTGEAKKMLNELGVSVADSSGKMLPFGEVLEQLRDKFSSMTDAQKAQYASTIAGTEASSGFLALINTAPETFNNLRDAIYNSNGAAKDMASITGDNLSGKVATFKSNLESLQLKIFEQLAPVLNDLVGIFTRVIDVVKELNERFPFLVPLVMTLAAGFGAMAATLTLLLIAQKVTALVKGLTVSFKLLNITMSANPILAIVGLIAMLVTGFILLWTKCEWFRNFWKGLWEGLKVVVEWTAKIMFAPFLLAWDIVKGIFTEGPAYFGKIWEKIKEVFATVDKFFGDLFWKAFNAIKDAFKGIGEFFGGIWDRIVGTFKDLGIKIGNAVGNGFKAIVNGVIETAENIINGFFDFINGAIKIINLIPGVNIPQVQHLQIPRLAKGGVLDKGARHIIAGEDGAEAIVPLENNTEWIKRIANELKGMLLTNSTISSTQLNTNTQNVVFNQTINSPKSLDRLSIYRDTNSLIFKGKVGLRYV